MTWIRKNLVLLLGLLVLVYTFIPIFIVVLMSFNDPKSRLIYRFDGFTMHNWLNPCEDPSMCEALSRSIQIGLLSTVGATILGTLAAFAPYQTAGLARAAEEVATWVSGQLALAELELSRTRLAEAEVRALRAQIDELNAEMAVASAEAERALVGERQRVEAEQAGGGAVGRSRAGKEAGGGCRRPSRTGGGGQGRRARSCRCTAHLDR